VRAWLAAVSVTPAIAALIVLELLDDGVRRWFVDHPFTTATLSGFLLLLVTVLIVNRVARVRQLRDRSLVTAAQAATISRQARRAYDALGDLLEPERDGDRDNASEEVRTYQGMLLISAPVLIDARQARAFLEQAQTLGALMSQALAQTADGSPLSPQLNRRIEATVDRVRDTSRPLLEILSAAQRDVVASGEDDPDAAGTG
jgi:hypothetical protein